ncbi:MAG: hypothetical protein IPM68_00845 [Flavobacteriales bacterium]|nr:hypothetical protein [Flavobacteriales bacterium]
MISWDALGYYLYLPAVLIHNDPYLLDQEWLHQALDQYGGLGGGGFYQAHQVENGHWVMKYTMGLSVLWAPFFALGHVLAPLFGYAADGFSRPYQLALVAGEMVYVWIGLRWLAAVLAHWWTDRVVSVTLVLVVLATNYLHQVLFSNTMSHVYLFSLHAGTLYATIRWQATGRRGYLVLCAAIIGIAALIRPVEIVLVVIPLLWSLDAKPRQFMRKALERIRMHRTDLMIAGLVILGVGSAQLVYWKLASGEFLHMSYASPDEGFRFFPPYTIQALFGFRKGWFVYTPLMVFAVVGLFRTWRVGPEAAWSLVIFVSLNTYVVTSWSNWWYSESFGHRGLMQSIAVLAVPLGALIQGSATWPRGLRWPCHAALAGVLCLSLFQTWQAYVGLLPGSRMSFSYYAAIFGMTHGIPDADQRLLVDRMAPLPTDPLVLPVHRVVRKAAILGDRVLLNNAPGLEELSDVHHVMEGPDAFSPAIRIPFEELTDGAHLRVSLKATVHSIGPGADGAFVITMDRGDHSYGYRGYDLSSVVRPEGGAPYLSVLYLTPELFSRGDVLSIYYWNRSGRVDLGAITVDFLEQEVPPAF